MTGHNNETDLAAIWWGLSDPQRLMLANRHINKTNYRYSWFIKTNRSLETRGLADPEAVIPRLTDLGRRVVEWALSTSVLTRDGDEWKIAEPPRRRLIREDVARLAAIGWTGSEIARELGVTREAVRQCCNRHDIELVKHRDLPRDRRGLREEIAQLRKQVADLEQT